VRCEEGRLGGKQTCLLLVIKGPDFQLGKQKEKNAYDFQNE